MALASKGQCTPVLADPEGGLSAYRSVPGLVLERVVVLTMTANAWIVTRAVASAEGDGTRTRFGGVDTFSSTGERLT